MKKYLMNRLDRDVFFDPESNMGFTAGSPRHAAMLAEIKAGRARLVADGDDYLESRRTAYTQSGLNVDGWLEAIVEQIGNSGAVLSPKFAALWSKREQIRDRYPKTGA
jgi:hypothetical protein